MLIIADDKLISRASIKDTKKIMLWETTVGTKRPVIKSGRWRKSSQNWKRFSCLSVNTKFKSYLTWGVSMCGIYYLIRWVRWTHEHILRWSPIISSFIFRSPPTHIRTTWLNILIIFRVSNFFFKLISSFMLSSPKFLYISSCFFFNLFHELRRFVIAAEDRLSLSYDFPFL